MDIKIAKLNPEAELPKYKTDGASGMDLYSIESAEINPGEIKIVKTGIAIEIPKGYEGQVRPRSGLAVKGITVVNTPGTIDSDYRGEIMVILTNLGKEKFVVNKKDRIAQLIINKYEKANLVEVKELSNTERGKGGLGSTGMK